MNGRRTGIPFDKHNSLFCSSRDTYKQGEAINVCKCERIEAKIFASLEHRQALADIELGRKAFTGHVIPCIEHISAVLLQMNFWNRRVQLLLMD